MMKFFQKMRWLFFSKDLTAQRTRRVVKVVFLVLLFTALFWLVPVEKIIRALLTVNPGYFILGVLLSVLTTFLTSVTLTVLVRKQKINLGVFQVFAIALATKFYTQFVQGSIVGGGYKWYRLSQPDGKPTEAFAALAFFRLLETFLMVIFGLVFWLLSSDSSGPNQENWGMQGIWLGAAFLASLLFWFIVVRFSVPLYEWFKKRTENMKLNQLGGAILKLLNKLLAATIVYADMSVRELVLAISAGLLSVFVGVLSNWLIARSLEIQISYLDIGWIYAVINLGSQIPFVPAGGLGLREVTLVSLLPLFGIGTDLALAFSFLLFARGIINALIGGLVEGIQTLFLKNASDSTNPGEHPAR